MRRWQAARWYGKLAPESSRQTRCGSIVDTDRTPEGVERMRRPGEIDRILETVG